LHTVECDKGVFKISTEDTIVSVTYSGIPHDARFLDFCIVANVCLPKTPINDTEKIIVTECCCKNGLQLENVFG